MRISVPTKFARGNLCDVASKVYIKPGETLPNSVVWKLRKSLYCLILSLMQFTQAMKRVGYSDVEIVVVETG